jgi:alkanesulfonate monooxygenase SsuD/methylene tetrahydromethanopterin reductase-like flavin-dependent oxidoreductase (luciferase family)
LIDVQFGVILIPYALDYANGRRTAGEVIDWDLQVVRWADEYGVSEAFFAEHYTLGSEPSPAPDLMIAAASQVTSRIRLGAAAHLLPYHNPIALAYRMMWLDHMTGGRYTAGFAPGAYPTDAQLFGVKDMKQNSVRMDEAVDIITAIWTQDAPFTLETEHWDVDMPAFSEIWQGPHLKPLQQPHPPVIMTGMSEKSPTLADAGRRGFIPVSQQVRAGILRAHWASYSAAATEAGHSPQRSDWRVCRDVFVADTDEAAYEAVVNGAIGRTWRELTIPQFKTLGLTGALADDIAQDEVTVEYLAENFWLIGSPTTVAEKIRALYEETGGFGTLVSFGYEYAADPEVYRRHFELLGSQVAPLIADLGASAQAGVR